MKIEDKHLPFSEKFCLMPPIENQAYRSSDWIKAEEVDLV